MMRHINDFSLTERLEKPWFGEYPSDTLSEIHAQPKLGMKKGPENNPS